MVYVTVPVNEKGQIVIPKVFREAYDIKPGSEIIIGEKNNELVIEKKATKAEFIAALKNFPKWDKVQIDSNKDYAEELDSR